MHSNTTDRVSGFSKRAAEQAQLKSIKGGCHANRKEKNHRKKENDCKKEDRCKKETGCKKEAGCKKKEVVNTYPLALKNKEAMII